MYEKAASRTERSEHGLGHFHQRFPLMWNLNFLRVDDASATAEALIQEADGLQGGAGLTHRRVYVPDAEQGEDLVSGFEAARWKADTLLVMGKTPPFAEERAPQVVVEVDDAAYAAFRRAEAESGPWKDEPDTVNQMAERHTAYRGAVTLINLGVHVDGRMVAGSQLYSDGGALQIEEIATIEEHRGQGFASAMVRYGEACAARAGHDLYFLFADNNDWPKELYRKLGFEPLGHTFDFVRSGSAAG